MTSNPRFPVIAGRTRLRLCFSTSTRSLLPPTPPPNIMSPPTSLVESAKRAAAYQAVADHLDPSYTLVGIGSGSTVVYVVEAIAALGPAVTGSMTFVPTGNQSQHLIRAAGLRLGSIDLRPEVKAAKTGSDGGDGSDAATSGVPQLQQLDVAFDGADEVDEDLNCIKGGGACHFQEKLVAMAAKKFICVAGTWQTTPGHSQPGHM